MKILYITYAYNNSMASGIAAARIAEALANQGAEVSIISSKSVGVPFSKGQHTMCSSFPNRPSRVFSFLGKCVGKELNYFFWEKRAYKIAAKIIKNWHPDVVYARSTPVSSCCVAAKIHIKFGIPVVMHFTDPWPSPIEWMPNLKQRNLYARLMESILPRASLVSLGNQRMLDYQLGCINYDFRKKAFVSPDPSPEMDFSYDQKSVSNTLRLVFLGRIHGNRNPKPLFDAILSLKQQGKNIELLIYDNYNSQSYDSCIRYVGRTTEVKKALSLADILVDIDGDDVEPVYISSKFKDYIYYGRPILSITPSNSPIRELVKGMRTVCCVKNEKESIKSSIVRLSEQIYTREDYEERYNLLFQFRPSMIASELLNKMSCINNENDKSER